MSDSPSSTGPKDVFLHLLSIAMLYVSIIDLLVLLFEYINHLFPDPLTYQYGADLDTIRFFTASLVIVFPVYLFTGWLLLRDLRLVPAKENMRVRKWLLYFTLFLAALTIIIDLVTLVYSFLSGDLTLRFILKVAVVFLAAASVFGYELWDLQAKDHTTSHLPRNAGIASACVVIMTIIAGFLLVGSPFTQRQLRFDERRVSDLQTIQSQVIDTWQRKGTLPNSLGELTNDISGFTVPVDPENASAYKYTKSPPMSFTLCATFSLPTPKQDARNSYPVVDPYGNEQNWNHGAGQTCFTRTIDPSIYPLAKPTLSPAPTR